LLVPGGLCLKENIERIIDACEMPGVYVEDCRINLVKLEQESYAFFGDPFVTRQEKSSRKYYTQKVANVITFDARRVPSLPQKPLN
jgi:hypothetical protein